MNKNLFEAKTAIAEAIRALESYIESMPEETRWDHEKTHAVSSLANYLGANVLDGWWSKVWKD